VPERAQERRERGLERAGRAVLALEGDADAARGAIAIMNAWSSTLVDHRFDATYSDGHLQAAWVGEVFPRAAEIIRYSYSPGRGDPALDVAGFSGMLDRAYLPHVIDGWYGGGANWLMSMAEATMNIGIFTDDYATFDAGVAAWRAQVPAAIYLSGDSNTIPGLAGMPISPPDTMYAQTSTSRSSLSRYWYTPPGSSPASRASPAATSTTWQWVSVR
jgi:hypothetical protein